MIYRKASNGGKVPVDRNSMEHELAVAMNKPVSSYFSHQQCEALHLIVGLYNEMVFAETLAGATDVLRIVRRAAREEGAQND